MGKNLVQKTFDGGTLAVQSWLSPAGVKKVEVFAYGQPYLDGHGFSSGSRIELTESLDAYCWGDNDSGQCGDGTVVGRSSPVLVVGGIKFTQVAASGIASYGIDLYGRLWAWGSGANGSLGDGTAVSKSSPVLVAGGLTWKSVSGGSHVVGLIQDGRAYAFGTNTSGGLGDSSVTNRSSPVPVVGGLKFQQVSTGTLHTVAIAENGDAYAWGANSNGQLGDNSVTPRSSPVLVVGGLKFVRVSASGGATRASYGITSDGTLYAWGGNDNGQLGDNSVTPRSSPVLVVGGLTFKAVTGGNLGAAGLTPSGDIYCWGLGTNGGLGDGTAVTKSSPVLVVGGLTFATVFSSSNGGFCAGGLTTGGAAYAWGVNTKGTIGDGTVTSKSSPVATVGGLTFKTTLDYKLIEHRLLDVTPNTSYSIDFNTQPFSFAGNTFYQESVRRIVIRYFT